MDWVRIWESHNEYEWTLQRVLMAIEPWGEARADLRAAVNTAQVVVSNSSEASSGAVGELVDQLSHYLKIHRPNEDD